MHKYIIKHLKYSIEMCFKLVLIPILLLSTSLVFSESSMKGDLRAVERSPLFKQKFSSAQVSAKGLNSVTLHNGVKLEFKKYLSLTRLDQSAKLASLMKTNTFKRYLQKKPVYKESILQLEDRLIVDRNMTISMKKGVCKQRKLPVTIKDLCFTSKKGKIPKETRRYIKKIRQKLKNTSGNKIVKNGKNAKQVRAMNDNDLLELMLNSDEREVSLVSVIPTKVYKNIPTSNLWNTKRKLPKSNVKVNTNFPFLRTPQSSGKMSPAAKRERSGKLSQASRTRGSGKLRNQADHDFTKNYFLTGFTLGRSISDNYEFQIARENWLHDRYYIRLSYFFSAGLGMRFPFSVSVHSNATSQVGNRISSATIDLSVAPINVNNSGAPAYKKVGLNENKYFEGKEFVLELQARCHFKAVIPGKDININCGGLNKNYSSHINPVLGRSRSKLGDFWIKGSDTGLGIDVWAGSASVDFGVQANITNGKIGIKAHGLNGTLIENLRNKSFNFNSNRKTTFQVSNNANKTSEFVIDTPSYGFDIEILPRVRARLELDLGIKEFHRTLGPYSIDALSVSLSGFSLDRHRGTVGKHNYRL